MTVVPLSPSMLEKLEKARAIRTLFNATWGGGGGGGGENIRMIEQPNLSVPTNYDAD